LKLYLLQWRCGNLCSCGTICHQQYIGVAKVSNTR
jgi:hypothetical protein